MRRASRAACAQRSEPQVRRFAATKAARFPKCLAKRTEHGPQARAEVNPGAPIRKRAADLTQVGGPFFYGVELEAPGLRRASRAACAQRSEPQPVRLW